MNTTGHDRTAVPSPLVLNINYTQTRVSEVNPVILKDNRLTAYFEESPVSEQYKILRTQVLHKIRAEKLNTILVTSPNAGEGKSVTAANLAIALAREVSCTALLVDLNFCNPVLHQLFGLSLNGSLADCLINDVPLSQLLINPGIDRLTILPGAQRPGDSAEIIGSPKMAALIDEMKNRYPDRYIIFDTPALLEKADALILSRLVDGVLLVVEYGKTQKGQIEKAMNMLKGVNLIGTVLNKAVN